MTSRGSLSKAKRRRTSSSRRNCSGPPTSTVPFTGGPTAILPTAPPTSSAAIGWEKTIGKTTLFPPDENAAKALGESKKPGAIPKGEGVLKFFFHFSLPNFTPQET